MDSLGKWEHFPSIIIINQCLRIYDEHKFGVSFPSEHEAIRVGGKAGEPQHFDDTHRQAHTALCPSSGTVHNYTVDFFQI